jgi:protocatechuate 3,4-dioxygenase beta subunit
MYRVLVLALVFASLLSAQSGGTVEGTVVDSKARRGIPGVTVEATPAKSKTVTGTAVTDAAGAFRIEGLAPGDYTVWFSKPGFMPAMMGTRTPIHVNSGGSVRAAGVLTQFGSLSGRVLDSEGRPFARVTVQLRTASEQSSITMLMSDETGEDGRFRFPKIEPGQYLLMAQPIESSLRSGLPSPAEKKPEEKKKSFPAPPSVRGENWMWVNTYYPGVIERAQAGRIAIHAGWDVDSYDIRMAATPIFRIRGMVLGEDGRPAGSIPVGISVADRWEHDSNGTQSAADGTFEIPSVHQGDWRLTAVLRGRHGEPTLTGFASVMVARHDLENVVIHLQAPGSLAGTVEPAEARDSAAKLPVSSVSVESITRPWSATGHTAADGTFRIKDVYADRYKVVVYGVERGYYVESVWLGEREITDQEVPLGPGSPPLRVTYRAGAGRAQGTVEDGDGATVVLLPKEQTRLTYQFIRSAKCSKDGRYEFDGLRPGEYYVLAFPYAELNALEDPEFVQPLLVGAAALRVENARVASADLKITAWPD